MKHLEKIEELFVELGSVAKELKRLSEFGCCSSAGNNGNKLRKHLSKIGESLGFTSLVDFYCYLRFITLNTPSSANYLSSRPCVFMFGNPDLLLSDIIFVTYQKRLIDMELNILISSIKELRDKFETSGYGCKEFPVFKAFLIKNLNKEGNLKIERRKL